MRLRLLLPALNDYIKLRIMKFSSEVSVLGEVTMKQKELRKAVIPLHYRFWEFMLKK